MGVTKVETIIDQRPTTSKFKDKSANIEKSLSELTEMTAGALQGKGLQFNRAESVSSWPNYLCSRCTEEFSEVTLYK